MMHGYVLGQGGRELGVDVVFSSYAHLIKMLADGWRIELPIYVRPRWRSRMNSSGVKGKENTYHFILWNGDQVTLVSVPDCPSVQQFLMDNNLSTDNLSQI